MKTLPQKIPLRQRRGVQHNSHHMHAGTWLTWWEKVLSVPSVHWSVTGQFSGQSKYSCFALLHGGQDIQVSGFVSPRHWDRGMTLTSLGWTGFRATAQASLCLFRCGISIYFQENQEVLLHAIMSGYQGLGCSIPHSPATQLSTHQKNLSPQWSSWWWLNVFKTLPSTSQW